MENWGAKGFARGVFFANELFGFVAVQCLSIGIQCDGGPVCVDGQFKDPDESGE